VATGVEFGKIDPAFDVHYNPRTVMNSTYMFCGYHVLINNARNPFDDCGFPAINFHYNKTYNNKLTLRPKVPVKTVLRDANGKSYDTILNCIEIPSAIGMENIKNLSNLLHK